MDTERELSELIQLVKLHRSHMAAEAKMRNAKNDVALEIVKIVGGDRLAARQRALERIGDLMTKPDGG